MAKKRSAAPALPARREFGPAEAAAALEKLHRPVPHMADKSEFVLHWADRTIEALAIAWAEQADKEGFRSTKRFIRYSKALLKRAVATFDALSLPKERRQAIDTALGAVFTISRMLGNVEQALSARKDMTAARAEPMQKGREKSTERVEARRAGAGVHQE
jgi:hypothetical protein